MQILEHVVQSFDTLQALSVQYFGTADQWRNIADFNNLDYPYITADPNFQTQVSASGLVTVTRNYTAKALTVPKGTVFAVPSTDGFPARTYASLEDVTIPAGTAVGSIPVQCTVAGLWGDIPQGEIRTIVTTDSTLATAFASITNLQAFTNGITLNVRQIGDSILIPLDSSWDGTTTYDTITDFYEAAFGTDIAVAVDGDLLFDGYGALGSVSGVDNLAQAVRERLLTPSQSLVYHPEYGSMIEQWIGAGSTNNTQKLLSLSIVETLLQDDRVSAVNVVSLQQSGNSLQVIIDVTPVKQGDGVQNSPVRVPATLPNLQIAA